MLTSGVPERWDVHSMRPLTSVQVLFPFLSIETLISSTMSKYTSFCTYFTPAFLHGIFVNKPRPTPNIDIKKGDRKKKVAVSNAYDQKRKNVIILYYMEGGIRTFCHCTFPSHNRGDGLSPRWRCDSGGQRILTCHKGIAVVQHL